MNKIKKFLNQLSAQELKSFELLFKQIKKNARQIPSIKKLKGKKNLFRVRLGKYRIILLIDNKNIIEIRKISKRNERTHKNI